MQEELNLSEHEVLEMINDTSRLAAKEKANSLSAAAAAYQQSGKLVDNVEFWKWMDRNYQGAHIFDSNQNMLDYISKGTGKEEWVAKQLQGKGYEYDWMREKTSDVRNIFKKYDAGDVANRAGTDVTETNMLTGKSSEYQMKAYAGKTNPDLHNTPKDATVVTNKEKADIVRGNGYKTEEFKNAEEINKDVSKRMKQIKSGKAANTYNLKNVTGAAAKAGAIACVIGMGVEAAASYKRWKSGKITGDEYLKEIGKAGGDAGLTAAGTTAVMIPVKSAIVAAGCSSLVAIPVAFVIGSALNKIIAPAFGRGEYKKILNDAKYYQSLDAAYGDLSSAMERSADEYADFVQGMKQQQKTYNALQRESMEINKELKDIYDSIDSNNITPNKRLKELYDSI